MKTDKQGCSTCQAGTEQYEHFTMNGLELIQYDYRTDSGKLFSCVTGSLYNARARRDNWLNRQKEAK